MEIIKHPTPDQWSELVKRPVSDTTAFFDRVRDILLDIQQNGDNAVKKYSQQFDKVSLEALEVSEFEITQAVAKVPEKLKESIIRAAQNIETFHKSQIFEGKVIETTPGVKCWQKSLPIEKVGLYIPGGSAPLFSTVLMLAIPARIACCREIILCTPPSADGSVHPAILFAAQHVGVTRIFKIGGVQGIGAMAYGTESVPKVYKIFGPGNQYVTAAKQIVSLRDVAIDMPAGPSEVEVIADETANPAFIAADLLSQAEHGPDSQVLLVTDKEELLTPIMEEVESQLLQLPREEIARKAIANSRMVLLKNQQEIIDFTNAYAPEHLIISTKDDESLAQKVINAGSVFLGHYTPESAGDYASGTNHTLPTNGYATAYSGVNLDSFIKKITFQKVSSLGLQEIGPTIEEMAFHEELYAHKNAVTLRLKTLEEE